MNTATAKVQVILEINIPSSWGDDCTVGQVGKQAIDSAKGILRRTLADTDIKILGNIDLSTITYNVIPR